MPASKRPTPGDTVTARQILLDGLARDADIFELVSELAPLHPRDNTFPGEVFLHLAADALDWCGASRSGPLGLPGSIHLHSPVPGGGLPEPSRSADTCTPSSTSASH